MFGEDLGQVLGQDFGLTGQQKQQHSLQQQRGARASRARPFVISVPAVVSVVLFDQNLDPNLHQTLGQNLESPGPNLVKKFVIFSVHFSGPFFVKFFGQFSGRPEADL